MNANQLRTLGLAFALLSSLRLSAQTQPVTDSSSPVNQATQGTTPSSFSLKQALDYALTNSIQVKNARTDEGSATARIGEIRSAGLPQVAVQGQLTRNIKIQTQFVPANSFVKVDENGNPIPADIILPLSFGVNYQSIASASVTQLLFDGSYFVGLKAAKTYQELYRKNVTQSKVEVVEAVTKAYYSALVNKERLTLLDANVNRLDSLYRETSAQYQNGFVEKIDADRIEVQFNNTKIEQQKTQRLVVLSEYLLKFQMSLPMTKPIILTERLDNSGIENLEVDIDNNFKYDQRIEYATLQTQRELANLDVRNNRSGYLPHLSAFGNFGYNIGRNSFDIFSNHWYNFSAIGLSLNIPVFDGLQKHYKIQQAKLAYQKTEQSLQLLENNIDLQIQQARIMLQNGVDDLKVQRRNLELAREVARVAKIKYQQGVGSNIEVINAETSYKEAQTNYYGALYDTLIARVDLDKATGKLLEE